MKINWPLFASVISAISGIAGTILTPIYGSALTSSVEGVLQAVSGLLMAISAFHVTSVAAHASKLKTQARYYPQIVPPEVQ